MPLHFLTNHELHSAQPALELIGDTLDQFPKPRKRRHCLYILSCYVRAAAIQKLIDEVADRVRLSSVSLLFDFSEVLSQGAGQLQGELEKLASYVKRKHKVQEFEWHPVRPSSGALVHAKAYAVIQFDSKGKQKHGFVLVGSLNTTSRGLGLTEPSNVELGFLTSRRGDVTNFLRLFGSLKDKNAVSVNEVVFAEQEELFEYALLSQGRFLIKWSGNLNSQLSVRYNLSKQGKDAIESSNPTLKNLGFEPDKNSISKSYLQLPPEVSARDFPENFTREYTIETSLGRWCPSSIWDVVKDFLEHDDDDFLAAVEKCLDGESLEKDFSRAEEELRVLIAHGFVDCEKDHLDRWKKRIEYLRENPGRLTRIRRTYYDFQLPYGRESDEIGSVFKSLEDSLDFTKRENLAMRKVATALKRKDLDALRLDESEETRLRELFQHEMGVGHQ